MNSPRCKCSNTEDFYVLQFEVSRQEATWRDTSPEFGNPDWGWTKPAWKDEDPIVFAVHCSECDCRDRYWIPHLSPASHASVESWCDRQSTGSLRSV